MDTPEPSEAPWPILPLLGLAGLGAVVGGFFMLVAGPKETYVQSRPAATTAAVQPAQPGQLPAVQPTPGAPDQLPPVEQPPTQTQSPPPSPS